MSLPLTVVSQRPSAAAVACAALLAAGCDLHAAPPTPPNAAAFVNQQPVTREQLAQQMQRRPAGADDPQAEREALERLIDDELALQKARQLRIDRSPAVLQAVEAARRDIVVRAYRETTADTAARPDAGEVRRYYDTHPALFAQRRVYTLQETVVEADAAQGQALQARVDAKAKSAQLAAHLKTAKLRHQSNQAVHAAEQLPLASLPQLAALRDGQTLMLPAPGGARLVTVLSTQAVPLDEAQARPLIEQFLWNENKRRLLQADRKALREAATIQVVGRSKEAGGDGNAATSASVN
jgi:EpsD family peptidyl-prolyl cis-trans isomerase